MEMEFSPITSKLACKLTVYPSSKSAKTDSSARPIPSLRTMTHSEAVDGSDFLPYGEHVQQGLSGVFPYPVPGIDHRFPAQLHCLLCKKTTHTISRDSLWFDKLWLIQKIKRLHINVIPRVKFFLIFFSFFYLGERKGRIHLLSSAKLQCLPS